MGIDYVTTAHYIKENRLFIRIIIGARQFSLDFILFFYDCHPILIGGINNNGWVIICFVIGDFLHEAKLRIINLARFCQSNVLNG